MISRKEIAQTLAGYDKRRLTVATVGSHSALQIFHGAKQEGLRSLNICTKDRRATYEAFPLSKADEFLIVEDFKDILRPEVQAKLVEENTVVVPHGSFVEYVGPQEILDRFAVPMFGNRQSLAWETDRHRQRMWLESAGLKMPREYDDPSEIDQRVFVKLPGAKGGRGFFTADTEQELRRKLADRVRRGIVKAEDGRNLAIQEFIAGVRYYPHYFASPTRQFGLPVGNGSLELLSMDKRIEAVDECYRGLPGISEESFDYTVTGNQPVIVRESLLTEVLKMGATTVEKSRALFPPGLIGPFSLETIYNPTKGFRVFEISARIVAGTNLYPTGSPYSAYIYGEPMSTGRRIARELKRCLEKGELDAVCF
jgi:5-formaminoimidazole-4-carboxamide-1-(beta)-D-ribofuranosyl 5'-monophosphate synthetase